MVRLLLGHVNAKARFGRTALQHAAESGNEPIVGLLLKYGADTNE